MKKRQFEGPVTWLLGSKLVSGFKWVLMYALSGTKADPRNWMTAVEDKATFNEFPEGEEFWFDYMADTGDAQAATYNLACLGYSSLWLDGDGNVSFERPDGASQKTELPRGHFLFIGGDTAYHIADYATLVRRLQIPFDWAYQDTFGGDDPKPEARPLFGIPGNHDYYDFLDGFNRQFRRPFDVGDDGKRGVEATPEDGPQLQLAGFKRCQEASYVALELPNGWSFWGLDSQAGKIDKRQHYFFKTLKPPKQLVLATVEPTTFFGKLARKSDAVTKTLLKLKLAVPFLNDGKLPKDECRLDVAGDIHHYARYWGPRDGTPSNYASVVAGGGGAFLHPTDTDVGEITGQCDRPRASDEQTETYPDKARSRRETIARILNPWVIRQGGYAWLAGALIATFLTWAVVAQPNVRPFAESYASRLGVSIGAASEFLEVHSATAAPIDDETWTGFLSAFAVLFLVGVLVGVGNKHMATLGGAGVDPRGAICALRIHAAIALVVFVVLAAIVLRPGSPPSDVHPFGASVHIVTAALLGLATLIWNARYRETLYQQARTRVNGVSFWERLPSVVLFSLPWLVFFGAVLKYGAAPIEVVLADTLVFLTLATVGLGLPVLAFAVGGALHGTLGKIGFAFLGVWHAATHLVAPVVMTLFFPWRWIGWTLLAVTVCNLLALPVSKAHDRPRFQQALLLLLWLVVGLAPFGVAAVHLYALGQTEASYTLGWERLSLAFGLGAVMTCVHFGWYLAVSLVFDGHNNEVGGAARIPRYRHLLRIKLTPKTATVYVIGFEKAATAKTDLALELVDQFTLSCRPAEE